VVDQEPSCLAGLRHDASRLLRADDPVTGAGARAARTLAELPAATPE
jgi:hypothetical protein